MSANNIVLVASTEGHIHHLAEIGRMMKDELPTNVSLLHMPLSRPGVKPINNIEEFVLCSRGVIARSELQSPEKADQDLIRLYWKKKFNKLIYLAGTSIFAGLIKKSLTYILQFVTRCVELLFLSASKFIRNILSFPLFYLVFGFRVLVRIIKPWKVNCRISIVKESVRETFAILDRLYVILPARSNSGLGRLTKILTPFAFWGLWAERWQRTVVVEFLTKLRPSLIVLPELNWGYSHAILAHYCRANNIPLLIIPYTLAGRQEWVASFRSSPGCQVDGVFRRLLALAFPKWTLQSCEKKLILPIRWILSCELTGLIPTEPWVTNSGPFGSVAVDNQITRNFYAREGVEVANWKVTGSIVEDRLYQARSDRENHRERLAAKHKFAKNDRWIVIALPPDQFDVLSVENLQFTDYKTLCRSFVESVVKIVGDRWNVIINLHPRTDRKSVGWLEEAGGLLIERPLEELLPLADVFISSASATIRWAVACGIPVINYDVYGYKYDDFKSYSGVVEAADFQAYQRVLRSMVEDDHWLSSLRGLQQQAANRFFKFDGQSKARMLAFVSELLATSASPLKVQREVKDLS
ncbi:MAG: hypothetical protein ACOVQM_17285 [Pirellula sp.]